MEIKLKEVATVKNSVSKRMDANWGDIISEIKLKDEYKGAFKGLNDFSHVIVITYLQQATYNKEKHLQRRPRNLEELPILGIMSQRGKNRPNPIGITSVKVIESNNDVLKVSGLDAINGTPVVDVKPYFPHYDCKKNVTTPEWVDILMKGYF